MSDEQTENTTADDQEQTTIATGAESATAQRSSALTFTTRTVRHGLFEYTRTRPVLQVKDGDLREVQQPYIAVALRGEVIEVNSIDLERGERLGALIRGDLQGTVVPRPAAPLTPDLAGGSDPVEVPEPEGGHIGPLDPAVVVSAPPRPKNVAPVGTWRQYAIARGMTEEEADGLTKDELIEKYPA